MSTITLQALSGRTLVAKILRPGDAYGLNDCLTWGADAGSGIVDPVSRAKYANANCMKLGIEFYDATYAGKSGFPKEGQFTGGRYYLETLLESNNGGLCVHGGCPVWDIGASEMQKVRDWARNLNAA